MESPVRGIDVFQKYQGAINWPEVAAAGVQFAFVKLTNGGGAASPTGDAYVSGAKSAGIVPGGYAYALGGNPAAQADAFTGELLRLGALGLAPVLDFEDSSLPTDTAGRRAWIVTFFTELKAKIPALTKALLYSSGSELQAIAAATITVPGLLVLDWDAEYGPNDGSEHPVTHYMGSVAIHQFTSTGHVAGIPGPVDLDDATTDITEAPDVNLTDRITVTNGTATLPSTTVGEALGRILFELTYPIASRATINADPTQGDTLLGRATDADGHSWDAVQLLKAQGAQIAAMQALVNTLTTANHPITIDELTAIVDQAVAQHVQITGTVQIGPAPTTVPASSTTLPAIAPAATAPTEVTPSTSPALAESATPATTDPAAAPPSSTPATTTPAP